MNKLSMVLLIVGMMIMMGISTASRVAIRDENPVYDIILQELKSSGSVEKECYGLCKK